MAILIGFSLWMVGVEKADFDKSRQFWYFVSSNPNISITCDCSGEPRYENAENSKFISSGVSKLCAAELGP